MFLNIQGAKSAKEDAKRKDGGSKMEDGKNV